MSSEKIARILSNHWNPVSPVFPSIGSHFRGLFQTLEACFPPAFPPALLPSARTEPRPPPGGAVVFPCPAKTSTPWNPVLSPLARREKWLARSPQSPRSFPRNGSGFRRFPTPWNHVAEKFPRHGTRFRRFSTQWKHVFHGVENPVADFPQKKFRRCGPLRRLPERRANP